MYFIITHTHTCNAIPEHWIEFSMSYVAFAWAFCQATLLFIRIANPFALFWQSELPLHPLVGTVLCLGVATLFAIFSELHRLVQPSFEYTNVLFRLLSTPHRPHGL